MIDTQRLGALLRALIRDDVLASRLRTPPASAVRAAAPVGPELAPPLQDAATPAAAARDPARNAALPAPALQDTVRIASRLGQELPTATTSTRGEAAVPAPSSRDGAAIRSTPAPGAPAPTRSAALELSDTGRVLLAALRGLSPPTGPVAMPGSAMQPVSGAAAGVARDAAAAVTSRSPLIGVPPHSEVATDRLALQLKDAVEFSGVFYEAHLAQWADDMRPRALLAHEPQSRWPVVADIAQRIVADAAAPADYATPLLRQQLDVLDTGRFLWRGELWPGQLATLVIEEDEPPPSRAGVLDEPVAPRWRMRLSLDFAELGAIDASVALSGESVDFGLQCADPAVVARLRAAAPTLRVAIAERALDVASFTVSHDVAA